MISGVSVRVVPPEMLPEGRYFEILRFPPPIGIVIVTSDLERLNAAVEAYNAVVDVPRRLPTTSRTPDPVLAEGDAEAARLGREDERL